MFHRLSIQSKMILLLLAVSLASIAVMAWIGYASAKQALTQAVRNQLQGVRVAKTTTLEAMLASLRDQVVAMSDAKVTIDGMRAFGQAHRDLASRSLTPEQSEKLDAFYREVFLPALDSKVDGEPVLEQYLPTRPAERYLQYHYIAENPNPYGKKQALEESPTDKSAYGAAHAAQHKSFARAVRIFGFEDVMLVDAATLDIIYSYQKTSELGTNLETGPYANTQLGAVVRAMRKQGDRDGFLIADFEPYRPSLGRAMGFAVSPIFDGQQMMGMLVLQFPLEAINRVLTGNRAWREEGLGETGECYLVGADKTMRSDLRGLQENSEKFLAELHKSRLPAKLVAAVEKARNPMCILPVETSSVEAALRGESGIAKTTNFLGEPVLSAYGPLDLGDGRCAVVAEISENEADAPIRAFARRVIIVASGMALFVTLLALVASNILTRPVRALTDGARRLGSGDSNVRVDVPAGDEFGELAQVFNGMAESIRTQREELMGQVRENQELLLGILPAAAAALRRDGDAKASCQFSDLSVLFAEIAGLDEFGAREGEGRALSVLGDLVAAFDDAAEKCGIEKVKTAGGTYLAVCGLSVARPDHVRRMLRFARELGRITDMFNRDCRANFRLVAGISAGPVAGGIVGRQKFLYELWGETVAIARKLAGSAGVGILVTEAVKERAGDAGEFRPSAQGTWEFVG